MYEYDAFICYAMPDRVVANLVVETFEQVGLRCWIAPRNIMKGVAWAEAIIRAINVSRSMVVIFSPAADQSPHVIREVTYADGHKKPLVFLQIAAFQARGGLAYFTAGNQCRDAVASPIQPHIDDLVGDVKTLLDGRGRVSEDDRGPLPAAPVEPPGLTADAPPVRCAPADFLSFAGLRYGDSIDRAHRAFGSPEKVPDSVPYKFQESHYLRTPETGSGLEIRWWTSSRKIMQIDVRSVRAAEFLRARAPDRKLRLLGARRNEILEAMGPPTDVRPGTLEYSFSRHLAAGLVTVTCPLSESHRCTEMSVHWYRP